MPLDIPATLGRKYGPLPGYAWMAIAAGGTYIVIRRRRSSTAGSSSSTTTESGDTGQAGGGDQGATDGGGDSAGYEAGYAGGYQQGVGDAYDYGGFPTGPTDQAVIDDLAALTKAETQQTSILRKVLKQLGGHPAHDGAGGHGKGGDKPAHKGHHRPAPAKGHPKSGKPHNPNRPKAPAKTQRAHATPHKSTTRPRRR